MRLSPRFMLQVFHYARTLPFMLRLVWRLLKDRRIPLKLKLIPIAAIFYIVSPIDIVPEFLVPFGFADDLVIIVFSMNLFVRLSPPPIVAEHSAAIQQGR